MYTTPGVWRIRAGLFEGTYIGRCGAALVSASASCKANITVRGLRGILMLSLLGILLFGLVALAEKLLYPWYDKA
jgi:hypothetical protein